MAPDEIVDLPPSLGNPRREVGERSRFADSGRCVGWLNTPVGTAAEEGWRGEVSLSEFGDLGGRIARAVALQRGGLTRPGALLTGRRQ